MPEENTQLHQSIGKLQASITRLERIVEGDQSIGVPSLRQSIKEGLSEVRKEAEDICARVDVLEDAKKEQDQFIKTVTSFIKWVGAGSFSGIIGLVALIMSLIEKGGNP